MRRAIRCFAAIVTCVLAAAPLDRTSAAEQEASVADCFADLMHGKSTNIACEFPIQPSAVELSELQRQSRGYLKDLHCMVSIKVERAAVLAAVDNPDHVFQSPPQPVACEIEANLAKDKTTLIPIAGTFAPRVVFKGGVATEATPGLANVTGVTRALSWPIETYVNRGAMVRDGMLQAVNAWVAHMRMLRGNQKAAQR